MKDDFLKGMATILWGLAWADHVEEANCYNLSGCKIEDHMPEIPDLAWKYAEDIRRRIEDENHASLGVLFTRALWADGKDPEKHRNLEERFGECLAYQALGHGVSWFDDHEEFPIEIPYVDDALDFELQRYAEEHCKHCEEEE
jgi:hypothetical protein